MAFLTGMLKRLTVRNFKGFERFEINFRQDNWLVGPNNAGKSTVIAALRTASQMARLSRRRAPDAYPMDGALQVPAHIFEPGRFGLIEENLRHEFRDVETRLEVGFGNGAQLVAVWPEPGTGDPFFYVRSQDDVLIRTAAAARACLPDMGIVPTLAPTEHEEARLTDDYVRANLSTRLASRHARNQLRLLREEPAALPGYDNRLAEFLDWARPWTRDFRVRDVVERTTDEGVVLDVFCREAGTRSERELFWAGDGVQVWIQLLMHLFRSQDRDVVVLDEPDLYLHADLQRRLVRLLESIDTQTVAASHSAEVLVEAPPSSVVWIAKERRRAVRAPSDKIASDLTAAIGSQFNLRLARALRAQAVVFVEGDDMRMLRNVATTLGATKLATESGIVTVPLRGFTNWEHVEPFSWLLEELLERSVRALVLLDRDYRTDAQIGEVEQRLRDVGVSGHVWRRKELENYLLQPRTIARISGAPYADVADELRRLASQKREEVFARYLAEHLATEVGEHRHMTQVTEDARTTFDARWADPMTRHFYCNAKHLIGGLNTWLQANSYRAVSARSLSHRMRLDEIPNELARTIERAEELVAH